MTNAPASASIDTAKAQRRTMAVLIITQIVGTVGVGIAPSIGVLLVDEITENEAWAGLARTASTLGAAFASLPLGALAARFGRRFALASGWWTAAAGSAVLVVAAQSDLIVPLFAGLLMIGVGSAVSLQARFAATDLAEPDRRARSLAMVMWVGTIGSVLGPNLGVPGQFVGERVGLNVYAGAFLIASVFLAAAGVLVFALLRPDPLLILRARTSATPVVTGRRRGRVRLVLAELKVNPAARFAVVAVLSAQIVMVSIMTMTPVHIAHQGGSITIVGLTISLHVAGMYALAPLVGSLTDRRGHRTSIGIGIGVLVTSLVVGAAWPHDTSWTMVALVLLGIGWSFVNVAGSALFSSAISNEVRVSSQGGVDALSNLCGATAAFVAGPLLAISNFSVLSVLAIVVLVPLTLMTAVAGAYLRNRPPASP